jgi:hypothetical protein
MWRLLFAGSVSVGVPPAAFEFKGAGTHDFFRLFFSALGTLMGLGAHGNQFFEEMTALAFKFINGHCLILQTLDYHELKNLTLI